MIFFGREWAGASRFNFSRVPQSLGLFAGHKADQHRVGSDFFAQLAGPRARPRPGWQAARTADGSTVLIDGWIDNGAEIAAILNLSISSTAHLYGASVDRWGDQADSKLIGDYAAVVCRPDETVRLSRSPYSSKALFWFADNEALIVSSIVRPMFAAGVPDRLRDEAVERMLCLDLPEPEWSFFENIASVPTGTIAHVSRGTKRLLRWYDAASVPTVRFIRDEDYVDAANALLAEAVSKALAPAKSPGMSLSGGLDSSIVCDEIMRQLPPGSKLKSFTFCPLSEWQGHVAAHKFGDDRPYVEAFAAMHPDLDPVFTDNRGIAFDDRAEQMFLACHAAYPGRVSASVYHGVMDAARASGCDWLFNAALGNATFSNSAPWAYSEWLLKGRWNQLWQLASRRLNDPRPVWRRIASHAVMPLLPSGVRAAARGVLHGNDTYKMSNPLIREGSSLQRRQEKLAENIITVAGSETRADFIRFVDRTLGLGAETVAGYEQVFGIRLRDVTAYRPLIEFCFGLPTEQFARNGVTRLLARRMGVGRLPEEQRTNQLYGEHNVDWHARMSPRVGNLKRQIRSLKEHPQLGSLIDADIALRWLEDWPSSEVVNYETSNRLQFFLPAVAYVAKYLDFVSGRNVPDSN